MQTPSPPVRLASPSGLALELLANGSIRRIEHRGLVVNLFPGSAMEGGPANLYLRRAGRTPRAIPLLGPRSPARVALDPDRFAVWGAWDGLRFRVTLQLAASAPAWFWHVALHNAGPTPERVDLVHAQDVALADYGAIRRNEYYVSQYLDHTPLRHPARGVVLAVRQNLAVEGRHPWVLFGSLGSAVRFATDALDLHGLATRAGKPPPGLEGEGLPGRRLQHEHAMAALQDAELRLEPGARARLGFFGWLEPDHPEATSEADLRHVERALSLPEAAAPPETETGAEGEGVAPTLFSARPLLAALELDEDALRARFGEARHHAEREQGRLLSFFSGADRHVVLAAKERAVLRPHGQILRTGDALAPDEASLTSTVWMAGTFHSLVTQGHVNINRFLSTARSYLGLFRAPGQRVFVELDDGFHLLDVPSACEMEPGGCRWVYRYAGGLVEVRSRAPVDRHELGLEIEVLEGPNRRFLVSHHVAVGGDDGADPVALEWVHDAQGVLVRVPPGSELGRRFPQGCFRVDPDAETPIERVGGDELLFLDGRPRGEPFLVLRTAPTAWAGFRLSGRLVDAGPPDAGSPPARARAARDRARSERFWASTTGPLALSPAGESRAAEAAAALGSILPWFAHDAIVHYLAPRGLEQYSGGGWGTRDVCQGPVEWLRALGRFEVLRDLLLRVFRNQNPDGDWPQWFMFFERERQIRPPDSHGDIVFWPVLALAEYVLASDDATILDERLAFFHAEGDAHAEHASVWGHVERALACIARRVVPGTELAAYGHGDWNDSLQPVDPAMRERLCSAWTVVLHHQTLDTLARALRQLGRDEHTSPLEAWAARVRADFQRLLVADGELAGMAYFHPDGRVEHLLHPRDATTGIHHRLLPMIHAISSGLFDREQAREHVALIRKHLLAPDGARLFDRPPPYRGGPSRHFQRAESSSFFGREIGIMYMHAHLRYAEAMARWGDAEAFFLALRQANPIGIREVVPNARPRQANCYASSSDAAFADRYEAATRYAELRRGAVPVEAGWRVYSSGAGIAFRLVRECLLGLRLGRSRLGIDPVLPPSLDGLRAEVELDGRPLSVVYRVGATGVGPRALTLNGRPLAFDVEANPYRPGGALVRTHALQRALGEGSNQLVIELG
jgi:cellobiose phosphorylase